MKDYYRTLGVIDDAEDIVIRAAYKALAQRYHPDKWKGNPSESNRRMSDINEAYDVLSDPEKRKKYDEEYFRYRARDESSEEDEGDANFISEEDEAWQIACEFFPNIKNEYFLLSKISRILANTYKATLINKQQYTESNLLENKLESDYLKRYYGENEKIQKLAKNLLVNKESKAAIKINKIIRALGKNVNYNELEKNIIENFPNVKPVVLLNYESINFYGEEKSYVLNILYLLFPNLKIDIETRRFSGKIKYNFQINDVMYSYEWQELCNFITSNVNQIIAEYRK
jgi:curved DNA-binding protein CbpA